MLDENTVGGGDKTAAVAEKTTTATEGAPAGKAAADAAAPAAATKTADATTDKTVVAAVAKEGAAADAAADADGEDLEEAEEGASSDFLEDEDGKTDTATKEAHDKAQATATAWRDDFLKAEEARLTKRAKTDEAKKAIPEQLARRKAQLARYGTIDAALAAGFEAQEKLRSGVKQGLPENASAEDKAAYYEANGIPQEAKAYDIPQVAGHKWSEADTPRLNSFKDFAHKKMLPQDVVNGLVEWQVLEAAKAVEERAAETAGLDSEDKRNARETLREAFGPEYGARLQLMDRMLKDDTIFRDGSGAKLWNARDEQGHRLVYDPAVIEVLTSIAVDHYRDGSLVTGEQNAHAESEENELVALMKTDIDAFNYKPWKASGKTAEARLYEIRKAKADKAGRGRAAA